MTRLRGRGVSPGIAVGRAVVVLGDAQQVRYRLAASGVDRERQRLRAARERPVSPILGLTPHMSTARRLSLVWGVHSVQGKDAEDVQDMVLNACRVALEEGFASVGERLAIVAGMPFGVSGTTNMIRIARVEAPESATDLQAG